MPPHAPYSPSAASTRLPYMPTSRSQRTRHSQRGLLAPMNSTVSPRPWRLTHVHALQAVDRVHTAHPIHALELSQRAPVLLCSPSDRRSIICRGGFKLGNMRLRSPFLCPVIRLFTVVCLAGNTDRRLDRLVIETPRSIRLLLHILLLLERRLLALPACL